MCYFFSFLIVDPYEVVLAGCGEGSSIGVVVKGHNVVSFLEVMPNLLAGLGRELVEVAVGVGYQENCGGAAIKFIDGSPPEGVDWALLPDSGVDLGYFVVGAEVEDSNEAVGVATGSHGILLIELGNHELGFFGDDSFHEYFILEGYFLDNSKW